MTLMFIYLDELRTLLGLYESYDEPQLNLDEVIPLSGKRAKALDMIRGTVVSELSKAKASRCAETETMSQEDIASIFGRCAADTGGPNPIIRAYHAGA